MIISEMPGLALDATTATPEKILKGYTAYNGSGDKLTGTALSDTTTASASMIQSGKTAYDNNGNKITGSLAPSASNIKTGVSIAGVTGTYTNDANAVASDILKNKTAYVNGNKITGTLVESDPVATINTTFPSGSTCTCTNGTITLQGGTSGSYAFSIPSPGTWTVSCSKSGESASKSVVISPNIQSCVLSYITYLPIGGRIFFDNGSNGATYRFFDASYNEITTQTVSGLANAVYYAIVSGTPSKDRWYVYDNTNHTYSGVSISGGLSVQSLRWGYYGTPTGVTSNTVGSGKTNTQTILTRGVPTDYTPNIWGYIKDCRDNKLGGCNDWFIASELEQDKLRASGLVDWYSNKYIWSSVEDSSDFAYVWSCNGSYWDDLSKNYSGCAFAARAF